MAFENPQFSITSSPTISGTILQVPLNACIIAQTPEQLSEKLARERDLGDDSFYAPYIQILPKLVDISNTDSCDKDGTLNVLPRFWDPKRIALVSNGDGGQLERKLKEDERNDLDPWAHACVSSRANYVLGHGYAMTPILDIFNHDSSVSTRAKLLPGEDGDDEILHLSIEHNFSIGNEVFISYGDLTNLETLCTYGFVSKGNKCNKESVDVLIMRKPPVKVIISDVDGSIDEGSLATLRSYLATPSELGNASNSYFSAPISDSNEEEVFSLIASFIDEAITDAHEGAEKVRGTDELIELYLHSRSETLKKALSQIMNKFPQLEL